MTDTALDPEEGADAEYPYCEAVPGIAPHNYVPFADVIGGTGMYVVCSQCGDHFLIDGTASSSGGLWGSLFPNSAPAPAAPPVVNNHPTTPPPSAPKAPWNP